MKPLKLHYPKIVNSKGEEIVLNEKERFLSQNLEKQIYNNLGYEVNITTLTTIMKKVSEQKFFQIAPADYIPFVVGEGAWSSNLVHYRSWAMSDDFADGFLNTGANSARLASVDAGVDSLTVPVKQWAKTISWSIIDLEMASKAGNWDLVTSKEEARKKNWDLGVQKLAFLGDSSTSGFSGLFNLPGVNTNTTVIQKQIGSMTTAELKAFCASVIEAYRANCARTTYPTHFVVPESEFNSLASQASADFPIKSVLEILLETFKAITGKPGFKILPCAYGDAAYGLGKQMYALYNYDEKSLRQTIPVDYTSTLANSVDNFSFQNVAYGQVSPVVALRPLEVLYFSY